MNAKVVSVSSCESHSFSKPHRASITLLAGLGVDGDAHCGEKVKHRSRVAQDPNQPNLRQVHLMHSELFEELAAKGFSVAAGDLGENITTRNISLLELPVGAKLHIGSTSVVEITGLRNPCAQIDRFRQGLLSAVLVRRADGSLIRKAGIMGVVLAGGTVLSGDPISVTLPPHPHRRLERV
jgi:MOSC domain-containing protein YiiM